MHSWVEHEQVLQPQALVVILGLFATYIQGSLQCFLTRPAKFQKWIGV